MNQLVPGSNGSQSAEKYSSMFVVHVCVCVCVEVVGILSRIGGFRKFFLDSKESSLLGWIFSVIKPRRICSKIGNDAKKAIRKYYSNQSIFLLSPNKRFSIGPEGVVLYSFFPTLFSFLSSTNFCETRIQLTLYRGYNTFFHSVSWKKFRGWAEQRGLYADKGRRGT